MTQTEAFQADLDRINHELEQLGAVITFEDGTQGIDPAKVPASLLDTYSRLLSYGYANGLI